MKHATNHIQKRWQQAKNNIMEEFITSFFQELIPSALAKLGGFFKWIFLRKKYTYKEILEQNWNKRIGLLAIIILFFLTINLGK